MLHRVRVQVRCGVPVLQWLDYIFTDPDTGVKHYNWEDAETVGADAPMFVECTED